MDPQILAGPLTFRRKAFTAVGKKVFVTNQAGELLLFVKQKGFKLKEDIRVYGDEEKTEERLLIQARKVVDFNVAFDVIDSASGEKVGGLRRKGWSSAIRDEWHFLDNNDNQVGLIHEDSMAMALVRRFATSLIPQTYEFKANGQNIANLKQHFNPFILKADFTFNPGAETLIDPRLAVAGAILLMTVEGRQG
ncbi:MAG: hypothetical protein AAB281_04625 [Actinomycetota bacterium]